MHEQHNNSQLPRTAGVIALHLNAMHKEAKSTVINIETTCTHNHDSDEHKRGHTILDQTILNQLHQQMTLLHRKREDMSQEEKKVPWYLMFL